MVSPIPVNKRFMNTSLAAKFTRYRLCALRGRRLAYGSDESGTFQIYVRAFPDKGGKWQISNGGGVYGEGSRARRQAHRGADARRRIQGGASGTEPRRVPGKLLRRASVQCTHWRITSLVGEKKGTDRLGKGESTVGKVPSGYAAIQDLRLKTTAVL